jgi:hypothetical protein
VACDADADVLIAGPGAYRKRIHVEAKTFTPDATGKPGVRVARVSAGGK